jgi:hypothetical protein
MRGSFVALWAVIFCLGCSPEGSRFAPEEPGQAGLDASLRLGLLCIDQGRDGPVHDTLRLETSGCDGMARNLGDWTFTPECGLRLVHLVSGPARFNESWILGASGEFEGDVDLGESFGTNCSGFSRVHVRGRATCRSETQEGLDRVEVELTSRLDPASLPSARECRAVESCSRQGRLELSCR